MSEPFPIHHRRGESIGSDGPTVRDGYDGWSPPLEVRHDASPVFGTWSQASGARGVRQSFPAASVEEQPREPADQQQRRVGLPHRDGDLVGGYVFLVGIGLGEADVIADLCRLEAALQRRQVALTIAETHLTCGDLPGERDVQVVGG